MNRTPETVENNKEEVPFRHYCDRFRALDPKEAAARCAVPFDGKEFRVTLLDTEYRLSWPEFAIATDSGEGLALTKLPMQTFLMRYLLEGKAAPASENFLTFREMPWGEMYIQPYTGRVLTRAAFTFGTRIDAFRHAAEKMGAVKENHGDAGYEFELVPGYRMQILVWEGDEEFPPNAQVLYSDNFETGFAPEDRVVAGDILISTIKANF